MKLWGLFSITPTFNDASYTTHVTDAVILYKTRYYNLGTAGFYNVGTDYLINEWSEDHPRNDSVVDCICPNW